MERMTWKRDLDGYEDVGLRDGVTVGDAICRLASYEDTGLEPNDPLTLDQLREMDGEPVWVHSLDGDGKDIWAFVDADCEMVRIFVTRFSVKCMGTLRHFKTYGKTWLAYRRKPEKGAQ